MSDRKAPQFEEYWRHKLSEQLRLERLAGVNQKIESGCDCDYHMGVRDGLFIAQRIVDGTYRKVELSDKYTSFYEGLPE